MTIPDVLEARTLSRLDGAAISDVACRHRRGRGTVAERATRGHGLVFVRRGCFTRSANGVEAVLDPTLAYWIRPGEEERYDHPHDGGDDCTSVWLEPELLASVWGGVPEVPADRPLPVGPRLDLEHRALLAAARRRADRHELLERTVELTAQALEQVDSGRVASGRPATARARRRVADEARQVLAADPDCSQPELARLLAVSPHHLSRVFRAETGHTLSRHRLRLRVRGALERLGGGETHLARLAAELGFADQSHLCRAVRSETGSTPAALRRLLA